MQVPVPTNRYFDRDLSWLKFNELILDQAAKADVPVLERLKFLSIYSSNLDEFYRVRVPVLYAVHKIIAKGQTEIDLDNPAEKATALIDNQLQKFGHILKGELIPELKKNKVVLWYGEKFDTKIFEQTSAWFYSQVLAFLQFVYLSKDNFYAKNNQLYLLVEIVQANATREQVVLNIPSDKLSRFFKVDNGGVSHIIFIDDIIKFHLPQIFKDAKVKSCHSFKITRDAKIDLKDDYDGDIAEQIEKQIGKRDFGRATRFLYEPGMPLRALELIGQKLKLKDANKIQGGAYHNLKDFFDLPLNNDALCYDKWKPVVEPGLQNKASVFDQLSKGDILVNTPYDSYDLILRFFNEAAIDANVEEIYVSLYRVAGDSRIVNSLISAAKNGKRVCVLVELKARFDEANNLKWAKKLKEAGVKVIYSVIALKVHAKIALVKRRQGNRVKYFGLLGTGNFNEGTAKVYTDHILMTANGDLLREIELLFIFLAKRVRPEKYAPINFKYLLVSKFNLQQRFVELIDREIVFAQQGLPAKITIKLNNLEERVLIDKLYEASNAGVKIHIIARSICCLVPGITNMSQNITVTRIVDRYLEHGRIFVFSNNNEPEVYLGSADWMNRNIYYRIEVCYPVYNAAIKQRIIDIIQLQLKDNTQAVQIDSELNNVTVHASGKPYQSQLQIYKLLNKVTDTSYEKAPH